MLGSRIYLSSDTICKPLINDDPFEELVDHVLRIGKVHSRYFYHIQPADTLARIGFEASKLDCDLSP